MMGRVIYKMKVRKYRYFVGDFETTVFDGQTTTEVWASALVELHSDDVSIYHSIGETFNAFKNISGNICAYYHNLKFDGSFWLDYLLKIGMVQARNEDNSEWIDTKKMKNNSFSYCISDMGEWYNMTIKQNGRLIELRDSLKLLPFSVKKIGDSFGTKHKKLDMEYKGKRYAGCDITDDEKRYIANDVLVIKEALEMMFDNGHNKLTIGSCCLSEYKAIIGAQYYKYQFPNVYDIPIDESMHKYTSAGEWIKRAYRGGWCYIVKGKAGKIYHDGTTADVNSLYPSMMSSESGNRYPVGTPVFWVGDIPARVKTDKSVYYFVRIRTKFYIKPGKLPFIQIKNNPFYMGNESLTTSDIWDSEQGCYCKYYIGLDNERHEAKVELTLTMTDFELLKEQYELVDLEILDGCYFGAEVGIFDEYINKYKKIKMESKGAQRELAKLFLNNLYGKMAASTNSSYKLAYQKTDGSISFETITEYKKKPGYIPVGAAITSYARNFTIRAAQRNYYGDDKPGFIYADTDSIHCDLPPDKITGIKVDAKEFCCWKLESCWDTGLFVRQKTYIEHITHEDLEQIDEPYYNVKCAGMPAKCKDLFIDSITQEYDKGTLTEEELKFVTVKRELTDFKIGLIVPGKLLPKRIPGGVILTDTSYEMRNNIFLR